MVIYYAPFIDEIVLFIVNLSFKIAYYTSMLYQCVNLFLILKNNLRNMSYWELENDHKTELLSSYQGSAPIDRCPCEAINIISRNIQNHKLSSLAGFQTLRGNYTNPSLFA